jgi:uncharacterized RDD family membrane protein YckC
MFPTSLIPRRPPPAPPRTLLGYYAGFASRLLAFLIDVILVSLLFVSTTWITSVTVTTLRIGSYLGISLESIPGAIALADMITSPGFVALVTVLFILGYHAFFLVFAGQTPGKALLGLRVVPVNGGKLKPWRAVLRYLGYYLSALPLFIGFLWVLLDDQRQAWHDKLAGTVVLYSWQARPDEQFLAEEIQQVDGDSPPDHASAQEASPKP